MIIRSASERPSMPYAKAQQIVTRIPHGEVRSYDIAHFEPYLDPHFDGIVTDQIEFLNRHVPLA